jgi:hypothetical protein
MDSPISYWPPGICPFFCLQGGSSAYLELAFLACSIILMSLLAVRCQKVLLYSVEFGASLLSYALCLRFHHRYSDK